MKKILRLIKARPFKTLTIIVFIYPILPLALLASYISIVGGFSLFYQGFHVNSYKFALQFIWILGGTAGLVGGVMVIFNRKTWLSLVLFVYGSISYTIVALIIIRGVRYESIFGVQHSIYIVLTLIVIALQIIQLARHLLNQYKFKKNKFAYEQD
jgi:heme A synthase